MILNLWKPLYKTLLADNTGQKFYLSTILSVAFSIAVVLATFGIMTGFERAMLKALQRSNGDVVVHHSSGSFQDTTEMREKLKSIGARYMTSLVQVEAFALKDNTSSGVVLKGIDPKTYQQVTGLDVNLAPAKIAIGSELAKNLSVAVGDYITLATGSGSHEIAYLPMLARYQIGDIVEHGIYEKDQRFIYMTIEELREQFSLKDRVNVMLINVNNDQQDNIRQITEDIRLLFDYEFLAKPYWYEFSGLITAVKAEKYAMLIILQIIVLIAMFNIAAFLIYSMNKKSQDIFLLRAVGMQINIFIKFWSSIVLSIWFFSCALAYCLTLFLDHFVLKKQLIHIPGSVYNLPQLRIVLDTTDYLMAFTTTLAWMTLICIFWFSKIKKKPLLEGLREEFA